MRSVRAHRAIALALMLALMLVLSTGPVVEAAVGDTAADRVVGQPDDSSGIPNVDGISAQGLNGPFGVAFDADGNLFVADAENNRVLGYIAPLRSDSVADLVVGQPDFGSGVANNGGVSASSLFRPAGVAVGAAGDLYVADAGNNRVLQYDRPFATDTVADYVVGQPDFLSNEHNGGGLSAASLFLPVGVALDVAGNLWVVDEGNHRVLEYDDPIATADRVADLVLGQQSFDTGTPNLTGIDARSLSFPIGIGLDERGNVWVADTGNNRVLEYDDPKHLDAVADRVLGQPSFASNARNVSGRVDAAGLSGPVAVGVGPDGSVWVCDVLNNRVLTYTAPLVTGDGIADRVLGQPDVNSSDPNEGGISARSLSSPRGVAIDLDGNIAVADFANSRVVLFETPLPIVTSIEVKRPATGRPRLVVRGFGMESGSAVVEVNRTQLATTKYREIAADGSARRLVASDPEFGTRLPRGARVRIVVVNTRTGGRSAPVSFTVR
jgi:sugar lactone lactonase YvrE